MSRQRRQSNVALSPLVHYNVPCWVFEGLTHRISTTCCGENLPASPNAGAESLLLLHCWFCHFPYLGGEVLPPPCGNDVWDRAIRHPLTSSLSLVREKSYLLVHVSASPNHIFLMYNKSFWVLHISHNLSNATSPYLCLRVRLPICCSNQSLIIPWIYLPSFRILHWHVAFGDVWDRKWDLMALKTCQVRPGSKVCGCDAFFNDITIEHPVAHTFDNPQLPKSHSVLV